MPVKTDADHSLDQVKQAITLSISALATICFAEDHWGQNDYTKEYKAKLFDALCKLKAIKEDLWD